MALKMEEDEAYLISQSRLSGKMSDTEAKAWALTAKSLIPRNFALLNEAYVLEKSAKNTKESAKLFCRIFAEFPNEPQFWNEARDICSNVDNPGNLPGAKFHSEVFAHITPEVQQQILLQLVQTSESPIVKSKLALVLFKRYPQSITGLWQKVAETLTINESNSFTTPCNGYRKLLVHDLLPVILQSKNVEIQQSHLLNLFQKAIEFYVCYLAKNDSVIKDLSEADSKLDNPIQSLTNLLSKISLKLGWRLYSETQSAENKAQICQVLWSVCSSSTVQDKGENRLIELYYFTVFTLFKSLFEYLDVAGPRTKRDLWSEMPQVLLVHNLFTPAEVPTQNNLETSANPVLLTTPKQVKSSRRITENFASAISCWELLHNFEDLRQQFAGLYESLRITSWPWFQTFMVDVLLYRSLHDEAAASLNHLLVVATGNNKLCLSTKLTSVMYLSGKRSEAVGHALQLIPHLVLDDSLPSEYFELSIGTEDYSQKALTFMCTSPSEIMRFIISVILSAYRDFGLESCTNDTILGNVLILSQYDWPRNGTLAELVIGQIRSKKEFKYPILPKYFTNLEVMEELMLMATDLGGSIPIEVFPNVSSQARISTRGGNKECKEDFRHAMLDLVAQCRRPVFPLILDFLVEEKDNILQSLK